MPSFYSGFDVSLVIQTWPELDFGGRISGAASPFGSGLGIMGGGGGGVEYGFPLDWGPSSATSIGIAGVFGGGAGGSVDFSKGGVGVSGSGKGGIGAGAYICKKHSYTVSVRSVIRAWNECITHLEFWGPMAPYMAYQR